jgi:hypothetical protein
MERQVDCHCIYLQKIDHKVEWIESARREREVRKGQERTINYPNCSSCEPFEQVHIKNITLGRRRLILRNMTGDS